ncbi:MAG: helix-turn-helix domain-containing protein [Rhodospirillaceae bacterium]|nr:helix-turn-helix domain-containing protein [Rhodospirillaceae bacterium]
MRRLDRATRAQVVALLSEGMAVNAIARVTPVSKPTILKLLTDLGPVVAEFQGSTMRDLPCERIQVDEIWAYVGMKAKQVPVERRGEFGIGDVHTFTAICPDMKLAPTWLVGPRTSDSAHRFLLDVARRMQGRIQLTTDGANIYRQTAWDAFAGFVDYAQLVKRYERPGDDERSYSPPVCVAARPETVVGDPDPSHISTSHVERQNLTMRMHMRRFTRLTNAFSKKVYNLSCAVALHFMVYNFVKPHATLTRADYGRPTTPAMAAGLARQPWTYEEVIALLEAREPDAREISSRRKDRRS